MDINGMIDNIVDCKLLSELLIKKLCRKVKSILF